MLAGDRPLHLLSHMHGVEHAARHRLMQQQQQPRRSQGAPTASARPMRGGGHSHARQCLRLGGLLLLPNRSRGLGWGGGCLRCGHGLVRCLWGGGECRDGCRPRALRLEEGAGKGAGAVRCRADAPMCGGQGPLCRGMGDGEARSGPGSLSHLSAGSARHMSTRCGPHSPLRAPTHWKP